MYKSENPQPSVGGFVFSKQNKTAKYLGRSGFISSVLNFQTKNSNTNLLPIKPIANRIKA